MKDILVELFDKVEDQYGFNLVDVGSMEGIEREWAEMAEHIRAIGFEPDERQFAKLKSSAKALYLNKFMWSRSERISFHVSRDPGKSSIYLPNRSLLAEFPDAGRFDVVDTFNFSADQVDSLDAILPQHGVSDVDFLKLDTQGSEYDILKGADRWLEESLLGLKVEVEFIEMYVGQPLFQDVDSLMRGKNFNLMDLKRVYWKRNSDTQHNDRGQMVFGDALYLKDIASFCAYMEGKPAAYRDAKTTKFAIVALRYGLVDYALSVIREARDRDLLGEERAQQLLTLVQSSSLEEGKRQMRNFRGAYRLYRLMGIVRDWFFTTPYTYWAEVDDCLGRE